MSFQAYIDNIETKTGKSPKDFMMLMKKKGIFARDMKASVLVSFLAKEFKLGHGHSMAIWAFSKTRGGLKVRKRSNSVFKGAIPAVL